MLVFLNVTVHFILDYLFFFLWNDNPYFRPYIMILNFDEITTKSSMPKKVRRDSHDISCNMQIIRWEKSRVQLNLFVWLDLGACVQYGFWPSVNQVCGKEGLWK